MSGRDYTAARLRVAAVLGMLLVAAPAVSLPSLVSVDWREVRAIASSVQVPHMQVKITMEVTP